MAPNNLTFGQINLQRSRVATLEISRVMSDHGIDAVLLQEQYVWKGRTQGIESPGAVLESGATPGAGVLVNSTLISPLFLESLSDE